MRAIYLSILLLATFQYAEAKKSWEKDPLSWSEKECGKILEISPWCSQAYKSIGMGSSAHYIIKAQWLSRLIVFAEAREEQLKAGAGKDFLKEKYQLKMKQEGLEDDGKIVFKVIPLRGDGMRGQNLRSLYLNDPFLTGLAENILLIKSNDRKNFLRPVEVKPLGTGLDEGFKVYFENKGFITPDTKRIDLFMDTGAGEFKVKFEPWKFEAVEFDVE